MKKLFVLLALLALIAAGCADNGDNDQAANGPEAEDNYYETTQPETTVVEVTTEETLPDTSGPR